MDVANSHMHACQPASLHVTGGLSVHRIDVILGSARLESSPMSADNSVSRWLEGVREGNDADVQKLWDRYFQRLVRLASAQAARACPPDVRRGGSSPSAPSTASATAPAAGQFPQLDDRDDLWRLLVTITARKAVAAIRHQTRQKRGGGPVLGESAIDDRRRRPMKGMAAVPRPGADPRGRRPVRRGLRAAARQAGEPDAQVDRPAQARGPHLRGDRRRAGDLEAHRRPQAPADPCCLGGGAAGMTRPRRGRRPGPVARADLMRID